MIKVQLNAILTAIKRYHVDPFRAIVCISYFANSVWPDETARNEVRRLFTIVFLMYDWNFYFHKWICLCLIREESASETRE